jgi:hypothetical protein
VTVAAAAVVTGLTVGANWPLFLGLVAATIVLLLVDRNRQSNAPGASAAHSVRTRPESANCIPRVERRGMRSDRHAKTAHTAHSFRRQLTRI